MPAMPATYTRDLKRLLSAQGWELLRQGKGSHEVWVGPDGDKVTVPGNCKSRHTANKILRDAGIDKKL